VERRAIYQRLMYLFFRDALKFDGKEGSVQITGHY
jgi:hypothetical protein